MYDSYITFFNADAQKLNCRTDVLANQSIFDDDLPEGPTMKTSYMHSFKSPEELRAIQLEGLRWTVRQACECSEFLQAAGAKPDEIGSPDDTGKLP
jgi:hypothetical protein